MALFSLQNSGPLVVRASQVGDAPAIVVMTSIGTFSGYLSIAEAEQILAGLPTAISEANKFQADLDAKLADQASAAGKIS